MNANRGLTIQNIYWYFQAKVVFVFQLSLGDASCYQLTTAENELGVVIAHSEAGVPMVPLSHCEMQCPTTFVKENRKVARPQKEHLTFAER